MEGGQRMEPERPLRLLTGLRYGHMMKAGMSHASKHEPCQYKAKLW